jgi:Flp pilus assembly protein TadD
LEKRRDRQTRAESKTQLVEQINSCLHSGDYSRALDLLRGTAAEFPNDAQLSELEKHAQDGVKRNAEANHLITQSQELFAQRKSAEAIQLLREAYDLDKKNSLARAILANALVEHAHSMVETDWLKAETLTNHALALNPTHPTAKTILGLIVTKKETSPVEDWVSQARKLQSSGDLFAALAWVAEGLAVHPQDPKLLQIHDEIQRDQEAQRRQARRGDLDDLRRLQREIDGAADVAAKQALAVRIQGVAAKHWTDGEILSIANALLLRLGLVPQESSSASPRGKGATVILHVPRASAPSASLAAASPVSPSSAVANPVPSSSVAPSPIGASQAPQSPIPPSPVSPKVVSQSQVPPSPVLPTPVSASSVSPSQAQPFPVAPTPVLQNPNLRRDIRTRILRRKVPTDIVPPDKVLTTTPETPPPLREVTVAAEPSVPTAKVTSASSRPKQPAKSSSTTLIIISAIAAATILVAATFFFTRKHYAPSVAQAPAAAPSSSASTSSALAAPAPTLSAPTVSAPTVSPPSQTTHELSVSALPLSSDAGASSDTGVGKVKVDNPPPAESSQDIGALLIIAGQDNARVFLNGKLQRQLTQARQLRVPNLELKDYVVQVSKSGFQDPPPQAIRIRKGEQARLVFNLQPQPPPRLASLTIQGGAPGTAVFVDQTPVGTIQPDGTLSVSTVNPGYHTVELRKERFKPRQFQEHFVVGGAISLAAADVALEAAPGELKITFAPADAKVAIAKGELLIMVSSGVPLNLAAGTYTLTARTADRFTRSSTLEVIAGEYTTLDLSLAPSGMSKWDDPGAWKPEKDSFVRKGGDFVLYGAVPTAGTFDFSVMLTRGHLLQWMLNYTDPKNYVLFQMDDNNLYRTVIRNGEKTDEIKVPDKGSKKSLRTLRIHVSPTEIVHQIKHGDSWPVLDRWTQRGANLSLGKFGFYIPGDDEVALSSFAHYADLNIR